MVKGRYLYVSTKYYEKLHLDAFPSTGEYGNITGMRNLYWGQDAYIIKCGAYAYKVDGKTFNTAKSLKNKFSITKGE